MCDTIGNLRLIYSEQICNFRIFFGAKFGANLGAAYRKIDSQLTRKFGSITAQFSTLGWWGIGLRPLLIPTILGLYFLWVLLTSLSDHANYTRYVVLLFSHFLRSLFAIIA
jgi:hypothetical protein